ncbi:DASH family cryptochrome [Pedobacter sp. JCM 36344]|uniref:DASH family cryptochrome n=1 Tax=Pedobacter sp. JCM 36344 TaxID=3374280 RepID=UPI00397D83B6
MKLKKILVWFRNDLRLHDNEILVEAIAKSDAILPVYFFDPRYFTQTSFDTVKTGFNRARFLLESILALRAQFQKLGGDLLLVVGKPEEQITDIVTKFDISEVYHHREVGPEETNISTLVEDVLWKQRINLKHFIGHTLYNKEDLPFPIKDIPDLFAQFKKKTERDAIVKECFESPTEITFIENEDWGVLPELAELGFDASEEISIGEDFHGGEEAGFLHMTNLLTANSEIYMKSNGKAAIDKFSAKLSAWLAIGCLSPRRVYWMIKDAEHQFGGNHNFSRILLGLLFRDYYRFMFKKHGIKFFQESELEMRIESPEKTHDHLMESWKKGETGHKLVDHYMTELVATGFINHAGRLLVATYLVHVLKIHWTNGAAYFEEKLIDYSAASNWGNWANLAGAGLDLKSKMFDIDKQIKALELDLPVVSA